MALPVEIRDKYVTIIDSVLANSDLSTISEKRIRKGIQDQVQYDITPQKAAIRDLIMQRFDIFNAKQDGETEPVPSVETTDSHIPPARTNGTHPSSNSPSATPGKREADDDELSDIVDKAPPKKKRKASVETDAAIAARLQAEEDKLARPSRAGTSRKAAPAKKKPPKKKTRAKATGSDDFDVDDDDGPKRKVNRETGFHKPLNLSPLLAQLFGEPALSRPQVTKRIWEYIKRNDLQDPSDKRFILCDYQLREIFKQDKVHMFTMTKLLNQQMYSPDD